MKKIAELVLIVILFSCNSIKYNDYKFIEKYLENNKNNILGLTFEKFSKDLKLDNVKWDKGYSNKLNTQLRIYHYNRFYLLVDIEKKLPYFKESYNQEELNNNGIWYIDNFYPSLHYDGLTNPEERMKNYWENIWKDKEKIKEL